MPQYLYRTQLVRAGMAANPTPEESAIVSEHFEYLVSLMENGRLILAGRTQTDEPFGITVLQVESEEAALDIMRNDPTIKQGFFPPNSSPTASPSFEKITYSRDAMLGVSSAPS